MIDRIAAAPISWGICEVPGWGLQMSPSRILGEMSELGITKTELGALGWLPDDLTELVGNLADNARKWAKARVDISYAGKTLTIADDGPGVAETDLSRIAERGTRLDEKVQGSGLGLSIVHDIADLYGLTVTYGRSALGGFEAAVTFP